MVEITSKVEWFESEWALGGLQYDPLGGFAILFILHQSEATISAYVALVEKFGKEKIYEAHQRQQRRLERVGRYVLGLPQMSDVEVSEQLKRIADCVSEKVGPVDIGKRMH